MKKKLEKIKVITLTIECFLGGAMVKILPANAELTRDVGSIPGSGRYPGGGHGNSPQYSCLENPIDKGAQRTAVHRATKSQTQLKQLSTHAMSILSTAHQGLPCWQIQMPTQKKGL